MEQNRTRTRNQDMPNRSSNMEQAEGSRESLTNTESMRNRQEDDLGTSSDRAMFEDRETAEERETDSNQQGPGPSQERGRSNAGGITNRPLDEEQGEQEQLPQRGRSQSESER
jgi:hypothetical protein